MALKKKVDYDGRQPRYYAAGRVLAQDNRPPWMSVLARAEQCLRDNVERVVAVEPDVQSAASFGGPIYGVEPSPKMRTRSPQRRPLPVGTRSTRFSPRPSWTRPTPCRFSRFRVSRRCRAKRSRPPSIPRPAISSFRLRIHSGFSDRMTARPTGGSGSSGRRWRSSCRCSRRWPRSPKSLLRSGWKPLTLVETPLQFWTSATEAAERLRLRPFSTFEHMTEAEIVEGLARLDAAVAAETAPAPIIGISDLLVLEPGQP